MSVVTPGLSAAADSPGRPWALLAIGGAATATATLGLDAAFTVVGGIVEVVFLAYFARHLLFAVTAINAAPAALAEPPPPAGREPTVSVLVAAKNEEAVVERLVAALTALDYPRGRLQIVIVDDDSGDRTGDLLDRAASRHPEVEVVHRRGGRGGKSGALNAALARAWGEVVVVFDADHRPRPDVLRRLTRHFADPRVAAVQGRCVIANPDDTPITGLVAIDYHAGYLVNEFGRQALYQLPAYGGANCAVRATALRAVGGWNEQSVTEDTDLTLRLVLSGWQVRYDVTAVDEEEGVTTLRRYWRQRYRWARGHQQVWRDYRGAVWRSPHLSRLEKLETTMFLLVFHVPVASAVGLGLLGVWFGGLATPQLPAGAFALWTLLFLGPLLELGGGLLLAGEHRSSARRLVWYLPLFIVGALLCTKAWVDGVAGRPYRWAKTARAGDVAGVVGP